MVLLSQFLLFYTPYTRIPTVQYTAPVPFKPSATNCMVLIRYGHTRYGAQSHAVFTARAGLIHYLTQGVHDMKLWQYNKYEERNHIMKARGYPRVTDRLGLQGKRNTKGYTKCRYQHNRTTK